MLGGTAAFLLVLAAIWLLPGLALAPVVPGGAWTAALVALLVTPLPLWVLLRLRRRRAYPGKWFRLFVLRPFWYAQLCVLLLPAGALLGGIPGWIAGAPAAGARVGMAVVLGIFAIAATWGYVDSRRLRLGTVVAAFPDLPPALDGLRIVQLSDLHVGPHTRPAFLARVAALTREARPDLVAVTGDLVDDFDGDVEIYARHFGDLAAPLGVWIVPGNHDVYADWPRVRARLARLPQRVLLNECAVVERGGARLAIVGTGDPAGNPFGPDLAAPRLDDAVAGVPRDAFTLALAHNPALWPGLAQRGVRLTLSGHTHWGQLAVPRLSWSLAGVFLEHAMGVYREGQAMLYVHPGTNYWGVPFRLGAPPEVGVIVLRRGEPS